MSGFMAGPPYHFVCKKCGHRFTRMINIGVFCPKCFSFKVVIDPIIQK